MKWALVLVAHDDLQLFMVQQSSIIYFVGKFGPPPLYITLVFQPALKREKKTCPIT